MFELNKEEMMKAKVESKARTMISKLMSEAILEAENVPEHIKLSVQVLGKARDINEALHEDIVEKCCTPGNQANAETLKKVLEYLQLVEVGIKQFVETTPFVAHTKEE